MSNRDKLTPSYREMEDWLIDEVKHCPICGRAITQAILPDNFVRDPILTLTKACGQHPPSHLAAVFHPEPEPGKKFTRCPLCANILNVLSYRIRLDQKRAWVALGLFCKNCNVVFAPELGHSKNLQEKSPRAGSPLEKTLSLVEKKLTKAIDKADEERLSKIDAMLDRLEQHYGAGPKRPEGDPKQ